LLKSRVITISLERMAMPGGSEEYVPLRQEDVLEEGDASASAQAAPGEADFGLNASQHSADPVELTEKTKPIGYVVLGLGVISIFPMLALAWPVVPGVCMITGASILVCDCCTLSTRINVSHGLMIAAVGIGAPLALLVSTSLFFKHRWSEGIVSLVWAFMLSAASVSLAIRLNPVRHSLEPVSRSPNPY
jgi:hypothetical protein